jgi:hypothetical protein
MLHFGFWPQEAKKKPKKKLKSPHTPHEKFGILDGTKYTHENFGILHFIIPKYLVFCILHSTGTKHSLGMHPNKRDDIRSVKKMQ